MPDQVFTRNELAAMIAKVNEEGLDLTPLELGFMSDITEYFERGGFLSEKQIVRLDQLYTHKAP